MAKLVIQQIGFWIGVRFAGALVAEMAAKAFNVIDTLISGMNECIPVCNSTSQSSSVLVGYQTINCLLLILLKCRGKCIALMISPTIHEGISMPTNRYRIEGEQMIDSNFVMR